MIDINSFERWNLHNHIHLLIFLRIYLYNDFRMDSYKKIQ